MIIKYINEGAFGSYKNKTTKDDKLAQLKKETGNLIEKSINEGFLKKVRPYIEEKYKDILYNLDPWYVNDNLRLGFVEDPKEIRLELNKSNKPRIDYELIVKIPVIHLETHDLCIKPVFKDRRELQDSLTGVMNQFYNYFQYDSDKIKQCCKEYFFELFPEKEYHIVHLIPKLHLLNHEIDHFAISGLFGMESLRHMNEFFFSWFDNYQIRCKKFMIQCERLKFETCEELANILEGHVLCDQIFLARCNGNCLESVKGLEKLISFETISKNYNKYNVEMRFVSTFSTKPGIGLKDYEKVCTEKLIQDVTGKTYDENVIEHRIAAVDDPVDSMTKDELIKYRAQRTKISSLIFNIDKNGIPIKDQSYVGVDTSIF